jgi:hypothetical protein
MTADSKQPPFKLSLIDRFNDWVERLPVRSWISYSVSALVLILVQILFLWLDGGLQAQELMPIIIFNGIATPFLLALIQRLDDQAVTALDSMRPSLEMAEPEFKDLQYKLAYMPLPVAEVCGLVLMVNMILMERYSGVPSRYAALEHLPIFTVVFHVIDKSSAFMYGVMTYHTIRQLRLVRIITSSHLRVSLFDLAPSQAFSRLTASTAVGLSVGIFAWMFLNPDLLANPASLGFSAGFTILAIAAFVWPLLGVHRRLEAEKARSLRKLNTRFEAVFAQFNQHLQAGEQGAADRLNGTIASLDIQHKRITAIPTWPWKPETARIALTAIVLPLMLMILQYLVFQALNR